MVRIVPGGMMASNAIEAEKLEQFRGREMMVKISQPRNLAFHRKFFSLLGTARSMALSTSGTRSMSAISRITSRSTPASR